MVLIIRRNVSKSQRKDCERGMDEYNNIIWGHFMNLIGNADITRPTWKYFKKQVKDFNLEHSFKNGGLFVASGYKV